MKLTKKYWALSVVLIIVSVLSMATFALQMRSNDAYTSRGFYNLKNTYEIWENTSNVTSIQDVNYTYYTYFNNAYTATYQYNDFTVYRNGVYVGSRNGAQNNTYMMISRLDVSGAYTDSYSMTGYARATCPLGDLALYHNYN